MATTEVVIPPFVSPVGLYDVSSMPSDLSLTYLSTNWVFIMFFVVFFNIGLLELIWWGNEITIATDPEKENPLYVVQ